MSPLKNKFNEKGNFLCGGTGSKGCGCAVHIGVIIKGTVYCRKCGNTLKEK